MVCQCKELSALLLKLRLEKQDFGILDVPGVRCGVCVDAIMESKAELVRQNADLRKRVSELEESLNSTAEAQFLATRQK